jgi:hypothetical protein
MMGAPMMSERKESWFVLLQLQPRGTDSNTSRAVKSAGRVHADHRNRGLHFTVDCRNLDDMKWRGKATLGFGPSPGRVLARVMLDSRDSTSRVLHQSALAAQVRRNGSVPVRGDLMRRKPAQCRCTARLLGLVLSGAAGSRALGGCVCSRYMMNGRII